MWDGGLRHHCLCSGTGILWTKVGIPLEDPRKKGQVGPYLLLPLQQEFLPAEHVPASDAWLACPPCLCTWPMGALGEFQRPSGHALPLLPGTTADGSSGAGTWEDCVHSQVLWSIGQFI